MISSSVNFITNQIMILRTFISECRNLLNEVKGSFIVYIFLHLLTILVIIYNNGNKGALHRCYSNYSSYRKWLLACNAQDKMLENNETMDY